MPVSFDTTTPELEGEIWQFLSGVFGLPERSPVFSSGALAWKYFDEHPWWPNGRSYVLRTSEGIAAHGCISPVRFERDGQPVECMQIIDWAAGNLIPGAGLIVFRRCLEASGGSLLVIGGSADTLKIIPRLKWFSRRGDVYRYARPLRPSRHFRYSARGPRDLARFARNLYWSLRPLPGAGSWSCRRARPDDELFSSAGDFAPVLRTRAWFDYLLRCPVVKTELTILENAGVPCGHALLSNAGGSVRIADFVVAGDVPGPERVPAFAALARYIAAQPEAAEIVACSSLPELCRVFEDCGLHSRGSSPVYLADPHGLFPAEARLEITMLIGDAFYLFDPSRPFLC